MSYNFIPFNRSQMSLLPPRIDDWVPDGHLAKFIVAAVEQMDMSPFNARYRQDGKGRPGYAPALMVPLLLYAYCLGERSSRKIEALCETDVAFKYIAANLVPDHCSISRFRQEQEAELKGIFLAVLQLCKAAGVLKVGKVALDGTKLKANAALAANHTEETITREIAAMLAEAAAHDADEDRRFGQGKRGDELPAELQNPQTRLQRLRECQERLQREKAEVLQEQQEKITRREEEEAETGERKRGRKPAAPESMANEEAKANVTDPESGIMKTRQGYVQGYNAQAVVTMDQYVLAPAGTQEANDVCQLHPMLNAAGKNLAAIKLKTKIKVGLADAGYCSEQNLTLKRKDRIELFVATQKDWKQRKALRDAGAPCGRMPLGLSARERMERKLITKRGRALYKLRSQTIEPVFGQIKTARGMDCFQRRGVTACDSEWSVICATHNLLKLWRSGKTWLN